MRRIILVVVIFLTGCGQANVSTITPAPSLPTRTAATVPLLVSSPSTLTTALRPAIPVTSSGASSSTTKTSTTNPVLFHITSPEDESIVTNATLLVVGKTISGTVVSVNGNLATIDANGKFQFTITLDEGPNIIEIVASDMNGNEQSSLLRVIFEP